MGSEGILSRGWDGGNIFLLGFMGSGKTFWGKKWATVNGLYFIDLDEVIETKAQKTISEIFEASGEEHFRTLEAEALRECAGSRNTIVACGGGTPCFHDNMSWMNKHGLTIYISATPSQIIQRLRSEQAKRPLLNTLDEVGLRSFIEAKLQEREPIYTQSHRIVASNTLTETSLPALVTMVSS